VCNAELTRPLRLVEALVGLPRGVSLAAALCDRPPPTFPIYCDGRPSTGVFIAEMDQQGVSVVLDTDAMLGIGLFVQPADERWSRHRVRNERRPPPRTAARSGQPVLVRRIAVHPGSLAAQRQHEAVRVPAGAA
jgi:hypothetical protein